MLQPKKQNDINKLEAEFIDTYESELDIIESFKKRRHLCYATLASINKILSENKTIKMSDISTKLEKIYNITLSKRTMSKYLSILCEIDDYHRTFQYDVNGYGEWWIVYASDTEAKLCKKRHISLLTFIELKGILDNFGVDAVKYYESRMNRTKPKETMTAMKIRYERILRDEKGEQFKARKYIRTEQDMVLLRIGDTRKVLNNVIYRPPNMEHTHEINK